MRETKALSHTVIPEHLMRIRLAQSEQMREFFIQVWMQNPELAKQGGSRVQNLLLPLGDVNTSYASSDSTDLAGDIDRDGIFKPKSSKK